MKTHNLEGEILENALNALNNATGVDYLIEETEKHIGIVGGRKRIVNALILLKKAEFEKKYYVEIKKNINNTTIGFLAEIAKQLPEKFLFITEYINPNIADRLKELDIPFIDVVGNAYINEPNLFIYIKGNKAEDVVGKKEVTRAFQPTGLKLIFALLCNPDLINRPYRDIQRLADIALGTIGWVIRVLKEEGFLIDLGKKGKKIIERERLLKKWVENYNERLRPKLILGRYEAKNDDWWKNVLIANYGAYWGGEVAGAIITDYLKPEVITVYIRDKRTHLVKLLVENNIRDKYNGNIEVLNAFWLQDFNFTNPEIVHPIIAYADLLAIGNARNIEVANIIYEKEIARLIGEN